MEVFDTKLEILEVAIRSEESRFENTMRSERVPVKSWSAATVGANYNCSIPANWWEGMQRSSHVHRQFMMSDRSAPDRMLAWGKMPATMSLFDTVSYTYA